MTDQVPPQTDSGSAKAGGARGVVDNFLKSPFAGIAPWIVMSLFSGPGRFEEAVSAAFGLALLFFLASWRRGSSFKLLEVFDVIFFGVFIVIGLVASEGTLTWLEMWAGELSNVALAVFAWASIVIRVPFTIQYAKEETPQEYWDSPLFKRVNYMITGAWAAAFTFSAIVGLIGDAVLDDSDNFWTGWILQIGALIFAVSFTEWYPEYAPNKAAQAAGEPTDPPRPIASLFAWVPTFVIVVGVAGLVTDGVPDLIAIGLIIVGSVLAGAYKKAFP
ncbi:hypothetical protein [Antrihabitans sp. YC2-6]|uniref:hypothetical protein n=1 Tax=Antrihabitans sp. YC2-6 TaxID=2799498 RepID=UPI0018F3CD4D|nr:hypothetical protein [Antrihabitans sp. YC2-6]MBJ8344872.1 hypothetical protein [Antrihabitans sp. YC2-6]